jgi:hypothetical protein
LSVLWPVRPRCPPIIGHGRIEQRNLTTSEALVGYSDWPGLAQVFELGHLGLRQGLFCLGCCRSLMLLLFAVGAGSLGWMLVLGALMALSLWTPAFFYLNLL